MSQSEDRRVKYTKLFLKESLIDLLEEKNIGSITIKELCEKADVNRGTFYKHYADQYALLKSIEDEYVEKVMQDINYTNRIQDEIYPLAYDILVFIKENEKISRILLHDRVGNAFPKRIIGLVYDRMLSFIAYETTIDLARIQLISSFTLNGCIGAIQNWFDSNFILTTEEVADMITLLVTSSLDLTAIKA
ncbi:MAG: TetR/AcrR family transcriptional regulator [Clostridia bacterium]|nr:TetR/AcrR family transcriptional regulator [Clostridia bacterium]